MKANINRLIIIAVAVGILGVLGVGQVRAALNLQSAFENNSAGTPFAKMVAGTDYDTDSDLPSIVGDIIATILSIISIFFIMLLIYGGYLWMTARGNESQTTKAKELIQAAVIGLIIMVSAYAISYLVTNSLVSPSLKQGEQFKEDLPTLTCQNGTKVTNSADCPVDTVKDTNLP
jgi:hypothetical protein